MKRREFLWNSAGFAGALIPGFGLAQTRPCPPSPMSVAGGTSATTLCSPVDAEADWQGRIAGALKYYDFRNAADSAIATSFSGRGVDPLTSNSDHVSRDTSGVALTGGACLRFDILTTDGTSSGAWKCFLRPEWDAARDINAIQTVGMGNTAFYVQFRIRFPPSWLIPCIGGDTGKKICIISTTYNSNTVFEHVIQDIYRAGIVRAYHQDGNSFVNFEEGGADGIKLQNAVGSAPGQYCLYGTGPSYPNCYAFTPDVWHCFTQRIKVGNYGGTTGNEYDLWAWNPSLSPGYRHLMSFRNYGVGYTSTYPNGFNGLQLLPYNSNRTSGTVNTYVLYDQVIISTAPIPCPTV